MKHLYALLTVVSTIMALTTACTARQDAPHDDPSTLLLEQGCYPYAVRHGGHYYYTMQVRTADTVAIWQTDDLGQLATARRRDVWTTADSASLGHFWSPELHRIQGRWYLYFEADDGNTDDHQIYVMECEGDDPMTDPFCMRGPIMTNPEWNFGLHPTVLQLPQSDQLYLLWSGWPTRRAETETQCIYIARMENPWTTGSERVMISQPEYEWERQWINPDGNRSAYPIFVNENPEAYLSPDGQRVVVCYSASGIWTAYTSLGMLTAPATADLLDPAVWQKSPEPVLSPDSLTGVSVSNIALVPSADGRSTVMVYEARSRNGNNTEIRQVRMRPVEWAQNGTPQF